MVARNFFFSSFKLRFADDKSHIAKFRFIYDLTDEWPGAMYGRTYNAGVLQTHSKILLGADTAFLSDTSNSHQVGRLVRVNANGTVDNDPLNNLGARVQPP